MVEKITSAGAAVKELLRSDWKIVFVDNYGRAVRIPHLRRYFILLAVLTITSLALAVFLLFLFIRSQHLNADLKLSMETNRERISTLVDENDSLMARLVVLRNKLPAGTGDRDGGLSAVNGPALTDQKGQTLVPGEEPSVRPPPVVNLKQFQISRAPDDDLLRIRFQIHKTSGWEGAVSGRIFVVLEEAGDEPSPRLVVPEVDLRNGTPARISRGEYFSINRFKSIEMKARADQPDRFERATVFIFLTEGKLLYKQGFDVDIKVDS